MRTLHCVVIGVFLALLSHGAFGKEGVNDISEEIMVYATRIPQSSSDIPAALVRVDQQAVHQGRQNLSFDEALSGISGVFIQDRYNFAQDLRISIRGFGARSNFGIRGVKMIVDDIPATLPDGQGQVDAIDLGSIDHIEIFKGPVSAVYGNASGGAIYVQTEAGSPTPFVEGRVSVGAHGFSKTQLKLSGESGRLNYVINTAHLDYDGYRTHSETQNTQLNTRLQWQLNTQNALRLIVNLTDQPLANDPGGINIEQARTQPDMARDRNVLFETGEALKQYKLGLVYHHEIDQQHQFKFKSYWVKRDFENRLPFEDGGAVAIDRRFAGLGAHYTYRPSAQVSWLAGFDYDRQDDDRRRYQNLFGALGDLVFDQTEEVASLGLFVQSVLALNEQTTLNFGLRYDSINFEIDDHYVQDGDDSGRRTLSELSPFVGLVHQISSSLSLYGNWSSSFETPTTAEFANPSGGGGFNPNLEPQLAQSVELGLRAQVGQHNEIEASLFDIDVKNELVSFEVDDQPGRDFYQNAGRSQRRGFELSWNNQLSENWKLSMAYTLNDFEFNRFMDGPVDSVAANDFSGNRIPGIPKTQWFAELKYQNSSGFYAIVDGLLIKEVFLDNANSMVEPSYTVANLRTGWEGSVGRWKVSSFVGINNLFDRRYFSNLRINAFGGRYYEPAPPRHAYLGLSTRFAL